MQNALQREIINMIRIRILGSASGIPTEKRFNESVLISVDEKVLILLDCGEPCAARLVQLGENYNDISSIFISHLHSDHIAGIPMLIQTMQIRKREKPLNLFMPGEGIERLKKYLEMVYLMEDVLPFNMNITGIETGTVREDAGIKVSAFSNGHLEKAFPSEFKEKYPDNRCESYSYLVETAGMRIAYSGDIASMNDMDALIEKLDCLILEFAHIPPENMFEYLADKSIKRIVLTHIHPDFDKRDDEILMMGEKILGKKVIVACDGTEINL